MSTGTLRRHYRQAAGASNTPAAARPVVEQTKGIEAELRAEIDRLTAANESIKTQAAKWKDEAVALGWEKPSSDDGEVNGEQPEADGGKSVEEQPEANADGDDLPEPPARSAKTADWVEYAEANPTDPPIDLTERKGLRDEIAAHYLGEG